MNVVREIICEHCNKPLTALSNRQKYHKECKKELYVTYHKKYNEVYNYTGRYENIPKRKYIKRKLKKNGREYTKETEYCKNNWNTVEGCLNCICVECIQEEGDKMLPWEKEGFYEEDYI
jgi:hypothetical protein